VLALTVTSAVLVGHRWAETRVAFITFVEQRCEQHSARACYDAGMLLTAEAVPDRCPEPPHVYTLDNVAAEPERGDALLRKGCDGTFRCACAAVAQRTPSAPLPSWYNP
jgi:hypothetical protein